MKSNEEIIKDVRKVIKLWQESKIPKLNIHEVHPDLPKDSR